MRRALALLLPLLLLVPSCKDGTAPDPSTVLLEVVPATLELGIGEIEPLQARMTDGQGQPLDVPSGLQILWESSDTTRLTVDASGVARGVRAGAAKITAAAAVDGVQIRGHADAAVLAAVFQRDESAAHRETVGRAGGALSATSADGIRYTLTVPEGALLEETELSLTPLATIAYFPGGGEAAAGAHFAPDGLRFYVPATLTVELPEGSDAQAYTGFTYRGDGEELHLYPAAAEGRTLSYAVARFSGYGLSQLTPAEIASFPSPSHAGAAAQQALVQLLVASAAGDPIADEEFVRAVRFWYTDALRPALIAAAADPGADDETYLLAELEYLVWQRAVLLYHPFLGSLLEAEQMEAVSLFAAAIRGAIEAHNQRCRDTNDLAEAYQVARFQRVAATFGLDGVGAFGLDPTSVAETLCLEVVIEELSLPETLGPGEEGTLDLRAGYRIEGHPAGFTPFILVDVFAAAGVSGDSLSGTTDGEGLYSATVAWPEGASTLTLDIRACLDWSGLFLFTELEVCTERQVVREGTSLVLEATLPDSIVAGAPTELRVRAGRQIGGGDVEYDAGLTVDVVVTGGAAAPVGGATDGAGYFEAQLTAHPTHETLTVVITVTGDPGETVTETLEAVIVQPPGQVILTDLGAFVCGGEEIDSVAALPLNLSGSYHDPGPFGGTCTATATLSVTTQTDGTVVIDGTAGANADRATLGASYWLAFRTTGGDLQYQFEANVERAGFAVFMAGPGPNLNTGRTYLACAGDFQSLGDAIPCRKEENVSGILLPTSGGYTIRVDAQGESATATVKLTLTPAP